MVLRTFHWTKTIGALPQNCENQRNKETAFVFE